MRKTFLPGFLVLAGVAAFWMALPVGCANIVPPAGGPRDTLPPVLLLANPHDSTLNFRAKSIVLNFDEYIDLKDVRNNLLFTPSFEKQPEVTVKGKSLTVKFRDSLESNTTYVFNFGNAITDMNESNVLKDFVYTFSTGPVLDSLELSGRVVLAETGGIDTTPIAVLYKNLTDSAVYKNRPMYVVRLDRNGAFHFRNLPADTFAIYVLGDALGKRYLNKNQLFAFADHPVVAGSSDSILLYAYREEVKVNPASPQSAGGGPGNERRLRYTQATVGEQDLLADYVMNFPIPLKSFDSSKLRLTTDSAFTPVPYNVVLDSTKKELRITTDWKESTKYNLVLDKEFASDTFGRQLLKTDTIFFTTKKAADYGKLSIHVNNIDTAANPLLQFVQNSRVMLSVPIKSGVFTRTLFLPGEYNLRILYDTNDNGKWDPGRFFKDRKQPEIVKQIERTITVKPDWENEFDVSL